MFTINSSEDVHFINFNQHHILIRKTRQASILSLWFLTATGWFLLNVSPYLSSPINSSSAFVLPPAKPESLWLTQSFLLLHILLFMLNNFHSWLSLANAQAALATQEEAALSIMLHHPNTVLDSFTGWRSTLHQTGFLVIREVHFLNQRACFNPAEKLTT